MQIAQTKTAAKVAAIVAGLSLVAMSFVAAVPAKADTISDLQAQIAALSAQLAALTGGSSSATVTFSTNLTIGSKGADVTALQKWLIGKGFSIPAGATGYFGAQTKTALAAYQTSKGITPAVGYFGPITRAAVNAEGGTTGGTGTGTVTLTGSGYLRNISEAGDVTTTQYEGGEAKNVLGVSADAQDGDVEIQRVESTFTIANSGGSSNLNKYVSDVSLYLDGKKIASMDPADGTKDGRVWTYRFADLKGAVIKKGATGYLYIKVTPVTSIGADESGDTVTAKFTASGIRAVGGTGLSDTYLTSSDSVVGTGQGFTVSSYIAGTLTVTEGSDNPKASQVAVSSSTTTGVKVLSLNMKAKNTDVKVEDVAVQLGTSDSLSDVISNVYLMKGSTVIKTKTVSSGTFGTTTFDNLGQTIKKDETANYTVVVDLKGDAAYADGTTIVASTTTYGWDVQDSDGATLTPSAGVAGNTQTLTATGITVSLGTPTASVSSADYSGGNDTANFTIPVTVTAGDTDVYIIGTDTKAAASTADSGFAYGTTTTSTQGATQEPTATVSVGNTVTGDSAGAYYKVLANTSRTFTLTVAVIASSTASSGFVGFKVNSIEYGATTAGDSYYTSNLDTFKTGDVFVQRH